MLDFRKVATLQAWMALVWGIVLLALPGLVLTLLAVPADGAHRLLTQMVGGMLFALGATLFAARETVAEDLRTRIAYGNATCDLAMMILFITAAVAEDVGLVGFPVAAIFGVNVVCWVATRVGLSAGTDDLS